MWSGRGFSAPCSLEDFYSKVKFCSRNFCRIPLESIYLTKLVEHKFCCVTLYLLRIIYTTVTSATIKLLTCFLSTILIGFTMLKSKVFKQVCTRISRCDYFHVFRNAPMITTETQSKWKYWIKHFQHVYKQVETKVKSQRTI